MWVVEASDLCRDGIELGFCLLAASVCLRGLLDGPDSSSYEHLVPPGDF